MPIIMPSSSPTPPLSSQLFFSFLVSFLFLGLFSSSPISATRNNIYTSIITPKALSSTHPHQKCVSQHISALLQLKRGFNLSLSRTNLSSWNTNHSDCCLWEGITCNSFTGHVIGLNLSSLRIAGVIDFESLFHLRSLQRLDLSANGFDGRPIPPGFGQLSNLTHLSLSRCRFYGQIPPDISDLTRLVSLDFCCNFYYYGSNSVSLQLESSIMGEIFRNLSNLKEVNLDWVNMSAVGSQWSKILPYGLPNLRKLSMRECGLSGTIHPSLSRLAFLTHLDLSSNDFSSPVPQFIANFTSLKSLTLSGSGFHGQFPKSIFNLPKLQTIDISWSQLLTIYLPKSSINSTIQQLMMSGTEFHGNLADFLGNFKSLTHLELGGCKILGPIPQSSLNLTQLVYLDLSNNNIQGPIPAFIFDLTQVRVLRLSSNNFSGVMDLSSLLNLRNLQQLDLSYNNLSAVINARNSSISIPQPCVNLSQLIELDLSNNNIQGPIPRMIFFLTKLRSLHLSANNLSGVIDLGLFQNLDSLEELHLSQNSFSVVVNTRNNSTLTSFSQSYVNTSQLVSLDLSKNNFQGPIPRLIFELTELIDLDLSSNNFSGVVDLGLFQNFKKLWYLDLSYNSLTVINDVTSNSTSTSSHRLSHLYLRFCNISKFPDMLRVQEGMLFLDLSCNRISGKIPEWTWAVGNGGLIYLNLSNNALEGLEGPFPHLSLSLMEYLDLSNNMLKGSILIPPPSSSFFSLANNQLVGEVPSLVCDAKQLEVLDLSNNHFTGLIPQCLGEISDALIVLNLCKNAFRGLLLQTFNAECILKTLDVSDNQLEGQMPKSLANCQLLTVLNIGNNHVHDTFPLQLANLSNLGVLVLRSNKFYGSIGRPSTSQAFFPQLQIIDVSFNNFSGSLPSNLFSAWKMMKDGGSASKFLGTYFSGGRYYQDKVTLVSKGLALEFAKILIALTTVDLSHNQFHGDIPSSIGELKSLHVLNISHNHFEGIIPTSLGNLRDLESLDLSQNSLRGKIPQHLTKLSFLAVLNLSQNQLTGSIPQDGQFRTFENDSFLRNPGLCGRPLSRKCEEDVVSTPARQSGNKSELDLLWIGFGVGHAAGFGIFFWTLVLWKKARHAFFMFVDRMLSSFSSFAKCSSV